MRETPHASLARSAGSGRRVLIAAVASAASFAGLYAAAPAQAENAYQQFARFGRCPFNNPEAADCTVARSSGGSEFAAGNMTVHLAKPLVLQGGLHPFEEGPRENELEFIAAEGAETLVRTNEVAPPLEEVVEPALLSESETARYDEAVSKKQTKDTVTLELAGPPATIGLNVSNLILESGTALNLPVKVRLNNRFLGPNCYVGSNASPINIYLTTGTSGTLTGKAGTLKVRGNGEFLELKADSLVNNTYAAPAVSGCGVSGGADAALDAKIGLPSPEGKNASIIEGTLFLASAERVRELFG